MYIVANVHSLPLAAFNEVGLPVPSTPEEIALSLYAPAEAIFERLMGKRPFPIMRFIAQWLRRNVPQDRTRATFVNFAAGQFLYEAEIGRASCREGACQYVKISVAAVA